MSFRRQYNYPALFNKRRAVNFAALLEIYIDEAG